jgi:DNA-binding MarR family transcriptional regulator
MRALLTALATKFVVLERMPLVLDRDVTLCASELHVVEAIGGDRATTVTGLCRLFGVTKGAISQVVTKLARKGYVEKSRNPAFGKEILLSLTAKGQRAFAVHEAFHRAMDADFVAFAGRYRARDLEVIEGFLQELDRLLARYVEHLPGGR